MSYKPFPLKISSDGHLLGKIIGIEWNQTDDTWSRIDRAGNVLSNVDRADFDDWYPWAGMIRVNMSTSGEINALYGDDNYAADGTNGRVMVQIPRCYLKSEFIVESGKNKFRRWISDHYEPGFEVSPALNQRTVNPPAPYVYIGAYQSDFVYDATGAHGELHSRSGYQPMTGGQIWEVDFDAGQNEPTIGDDVSTPNDANWFIVDYNVTAGAWATNDAEGKLWIRKPGDNALGWLDNDTITNNTQVNTLADCEFAGGAKTALSLNIGDARTYAGNIGTNWGLTSLWTVDLYTLLCLIEYGNLDSQTNIGRGIVDKAGGIGFNGELTGTDSIDSQLAANLTGSGTGTNGLTPVAYRGIENPWGNVWTFCDGYNALDGDVGGGADVRYRLINQDGSGTFADPIAGGDYEESSNISNPGNGWIDDLVFEDILKFLFIAASTGGSDSTDIPDYFYEHDPAETNIMLSGGNWRDASKAGIADRISNSDATASYRRIGSRLEFIP